jgi:hypothetical protein
MSGINNRCFVIMPFSETKTHQKVYWDKHYEEFLKPIINSCNGLETFRSTPLREDIREQIINNLVFCPVVVADLTDYNPNVFWELGVRQSFKHGTITIAENSSNNPFEIPFHMSTKSIIYYDHNNFERDSEFTKEFRKAIMDCINNPTNPDSIILETVTGRGSIYEIIHHQEIIRRIEALISENELNMFWLNKIYETIDENKRKRFAFIRGKHTIVTRLSSSALELLLTERYLEQDTEFYSYSNMLLSLIHSINHLLTTWDYESSKNVEKWFQNIDRLKLPEYLRQYGEKLKGIQQNLLSSH